MLGFAVLHYVAHFCFTSLPCWVFNLAQLLETGTNINEIYSESEALGFFCVCVF